jgi:hypothetical protein
LGFTFLWHRLMMTESAPVKTPLLTLDIKPRPHEAVKPAELIQVTGHHHLTLNARRAITVLWHNAHSQGIKEGKDYHIEIDDLKPASHKGYEMVEEAILALMQTVLVVKMPDGKTRRVQFLGANDLDEPSRPAGCLTYSFDKRLIQILQQSAIWGKITIPVLMAFTSKYAISLYENIAQFANLSHKTFETYSLDEFRELLGVSPGHYNTFGQLNKHVVKPAAAEVNALASFGITILPIKQGKRVVQVRIGWWPKDSTALNESWQELKRTKLGRRARVAGLAEHVIEPQQSPGRLIRQHRKSVST